MDSDSLIINYATVHKPLDYFNCHDLCQQKQLKRSTDFRVVLSFECSIIDSRAHLDLHMCGGISLALNPTLLHQSTA